MQKTYKYLEKSEGVSYFTKLKRWFSLLSWIFLSSTGLGWVPTLEHINQNSTQRPENDSFLKETVRCYKRQELCPAAFPCPGVLPTPGPATSNIILHWGMKEWIIYCTLMRVPGKAGVFQLSSLILTTPPWDLYFEPILSKIVNKVAGMKLLSIKVETKFKARSFNSLSQLFPTIPLWWHLLDCSPW